jgi:hypothetical protein
LLAVTVMFATAGRTVASDDDDDDLDYPGLSQSSSDLYFVGQVGKKLRIQMALSVLGRNGEDAEGSLRIHGWYFYDSIGTPLKLRGVLKEEELTLTERAGERVTGRFTGRFNPVAARHELKWSSPDGSRTLDASLTLVAESNRLQEDRGSTISAAAEWPRFRGDEPLTKSVERVLKKEARQFIMYAVRPANGEDLESDGGFSIPQTFEMRNTVLFFSPALISLQTYDYSYTGGAHGLYGFGGRCFVLRNGRAHELSLSDLFRRDSGFVHRLSDLCIADLRRQEASNAPDGKGERLRLDDLANFQVTRAGLTFVFNPYTMGCYAEGVYRVDVPWKRISDLLADVPELRRLARLRIKPSGK